MLKFLTRLLRPQAAAAPPAPPPGEALRLAQAALLVHAGRADGAISPPEERALDRLLGEGFGLAAPDRARLLARATRAEAEAADLYRWTRTVNDQMGEDGKLQLIERLWEVVYADGRLDDFEANLLRRLAGLLYVPDRAAAEARRRVLERRGS